jgi:hypothetical protein
VVEVGEDVAWKALNKELAVVCGLRMAGVCEDGAGVSDGTVSLSSIGECNLMRGIIVLLGAMFTMVTMAVLRVNGNGQYAGVAISKRQLET